MRFTNRYLLPVTLIAIGIGILGLFTPNDLDYRDDSLQGLYVIDVFYNHNFILQTARQADPASKPPMYNWLAAAVSVPFGEVNELTIKLPSVLAGVGLAVVTFLFACDMFSEFVALVTCLILMANFLYIKLIYTARTDMLLTFFITLAFYFFYKGYNSKKREFYILFWLALTLATLTKNLVALLPVFAVITYFVIIKDFTELKRFIRISLLGLIIWLIIAGGWFVLAIEKGGLAVWNKLIMNELWQHFWGVGVPAEDARPFYYTIGYIIGKFMPWCLFLPAAIRAVFPPTDQPPRNKLILPFVWFITFLAIFTISKGKRVDYVFMFCPAMAILIAGLWQGMSPQSVKWFNKTLYVATLGIFAFFKPNKSIRALAILLILTLLGNIYWGFWGTADARTRQPQLTKEFCEQAKKIIGNSKFYIYAPNSLSFYMKSNAGVPEIGQAGYFLDNGAYIIMPKSFWPTALERFVRGLNDIVRERERIKAEYKIVLESKPIGEDKNEYLLLKSRW